jgi:hypothetical protein
VQPGLLSFDVVGNQLSLFLNGTLIGSVKDGALSGPGTVGVTGGAGTQVGDFTAG